MPVSDRLRGDVNRPDVDGRFSGEQVLARRVPAFEACAFGRSRRRRQSSRSPRLQNSRISRAASATIARPISAIVSSIREAPPFLALLDCTADSLIAHLQRHIDLVTSFVGERRLADELDGPPQEDTL